MALEEKVGGKLTPLTELQISQLQTAARDASANAYAPYSQMRVGAAVLTDSDETFSGCNVENASYGLTTCAERIAIFTALARRGPRTRIKAVAIFCDSDIPCSPCGACRQVIAEFADDVPVIFSHGAAWERTTSSKLLPHSFRM